MGIYGMWMYVVVAHKASSTMASWGIPELNGGFMGEQKSINPICSMYGINLPTKLGDV